MWPGLIFRHCAKKRRNVWVYLQKKKKSFVKLPRLVLLVQEVDMFRYILLSFYHKGMAPVRVIHSNFMSCGLKFQYLWAVANQVEKIKQKFKTYGNYACSQNEENREVIFLVLFLFCDCFEFILKTFRLSTLIILT